MRTERLRLLAFLVPTTLAAVAVVACSSDPPKKAASTKKDTSGDKDTKSDTDATEQQQTAPRPTTTTTAPPPPFDAGARAFPDASLPKPPPNSQPPAPTTQFCRQLAGCCGQLGVLDQVACRLTAGYNDETACGVELAVCSGGGFEGIGDSLGLFNQNNPQCASLARCCDTFQRDGYTATASDCQEWAQTGNETWCSDQIATYQSYGSCF
jgi:hypothetical protein